MKNKVQSFGKFLSSMVMPNIGAFIAWGFLTALFISTGWFPNDRLATIVDPMLMYLLPILVGYTGGKVVGGDRGAVMGAIATIGVVVGSDQTMLIGGMIMGPIGGWVIKKFDEQVDGKIPAGFEMLINNFSIGILGMILAIIGYYLIGPVMSAVLVVLESGVQFLIDNTLLPLVAIFIEPAKVLFLNNAINHGIFTPLGAEQVSEAGKSIMYMIESNPGPGLGVLAAYWAFSQDKITKSSAPGAIIIHFFGGIHEIYFPYVLMNPVILLAPMAGSAAAIFFYSITGAGLSFAASPGSIIAFLAAAPRGETLLVLAGVAIAAVVSFLVAAPIVKMGGKKSLDDAKDDVKSMKSTTAPVAIEGKVSQVIFACDAGMGSSAMGATKFRNRIAPLNLGIKVTNSSVDNVPAGTDIVVCQAALQDRARKSAPNAQLVVINNFLADPALDALFAQVEAMATGETAPAEESVKADSKKKILIADGIVLGCTATTKEEAIQSAGKLLNKLGYVDATYVPAMLEREKTVSTYMGFGVAIPHGTAAAKDAVKKSGIVMLQFPNGVSFGDEDAQLVFGIAGVGDEHLDLLAKIGEMMEDESNLSALKTTTDVEKVLAMLG
ncbi:PTS mannitol transporter subunit IICBA [Bengtsoniella intestinalis]|uniref:PTS mannitol transporter subunit IICBA n=1 Tax=Bengtsoniella intestinalis TaxID=3073143 RepID=UPI00391F46CE